LTVVTGSNGSGKSSFYRALRLISEVAHGGVIGALAAKGGLSSTLWAGPDAFSRAVKAGDLPVEDTRRKSPVALKLGFTSEDFGYAMDMGPPVNDFAGFQELSMFNAVPEIKLESVWNGERWQGETAGLSLGCPVEGVPRWPLRTQRQNVEPAVFLRRLGPRHQDQDRRAYASGLGVRDNCVSMV
jgi:energy-coupling factor transporter ATP-binding protein EcfA2